MTKLEDKFRRFAEKDKAAELGVEGVDILHRQMDLDEKAPLDAAGRELEETLARVPLLNIADYSDASLFEAAARAAPDRAFHFHYDPGWWLEESEPRAGGGRLLRFSSKPPATGQGGIPVNGSGWRDAVTRVVGTRAGVEATEPRWAFRTLTAPRPRRRCATCSTATA